MQDQTNAETLKFFLCLGITISIIYNDKVLTLKLKLVCPEKKREKKHYMHMSPENNLVSLSLKTKETSI